MPDANNTKCGYYNRLVVVSLMSVVARRFIIVALSLFACSRYVFVVSESPSSTWYTKYDSYPRYCSTPSEMEKRHVPPIQSSKDIGETRIVHVSAILRHGARTPYKAGLNCWDDYTISAETSKWDCNLTTFLAPPPPERIHQEEGHGGNNSDASDKAMFLFEKLYDALEPTDPNSNTTNDVIRNELGGTCQMGQLLLQGYEQELMNGKILREAYVYDENDKDQDKRMELLDATKNGVDGKYIWDSLNYRVDDDQRTLMSGQVVLRGMFGPELTSYVKANNKYPIIPLHTADRHRDIEDPNEEICPRLKEINEQNKQSSGYIALNTSIEANTLRAFQNDVLKIPDRTKEMDAIDCLMTTMCTDRTLPKSVNDYNKTQHSDNYDGSNNTATPVAAVPNDDDEWDAKYGTNRFQRLIDFETAMYGYNSKANDGVYAKLGMGPLWSEVMEYVYPFVDGTNREEENMRSLSIVAGHDTTIIPMLVSLGSNVWDGEWPPYASMMIIEIHAINMDALSNKTMFRSDHAFRLIHNGIVLTSRVDGCYPDAELCDAAILVDRLKDIAIRDINCTRQHPEVTKSTTPLDAVVAETEKILQTTTGENGTVAFAIVVVLVIIMSAFIGSCCTYIYLTRSCCCFTRSKRGVGGYHLNLNGTNNGCCDEEVTLTSINGKNGVERKSYTDEEEDKKIASLSLT